MDRIIKKTKGKNNSHIRDVHKRHNTALTLDLNVEAVEDNIFIELSLKTLLHLLSFAVQIL